MTDKKKKKILIVEDEIVLCKLYVKLLNKNNYEAEGETLGKKGLEKIQKNKYDLILLDLQLPDIHGIEILKKIRENKNKCNVVVLTNFTDDKMIEKAMRHGAKAYIKKINLTPDEFIKEINNFFSFQLFSKSFS